MPECHISLSWSSLSQPSSPASSPQLPSLAASPLSGPAHQNPQGRPRSVRCVLSRRQRRKLREYLLPRRPSRRTKSRSSCEVRSRPKRGGACVRSHRASCEPRRPRTSNPLHERC